MFIVLLSIGIFSMILINIIKKIFDGVGTANFILWFLSLFVLGMVISTLVISCIEGCSILIIIFTIITCITYCIVVFNLGQLTFGGDVGDLDGRNLQMSKYLTKRSALINRVYNKASIAFYVSAILSITFYAC